MEDHPDKIWDEYDWERFLRQQDRKTDQYMALFEKYLHEPNRDQLIAAEMGWEFEELDEVIDFMDMGEMEEEEEAEYEGAAEAEDDFEAHPLYQASLSLAVWVDQLLDDIAEAENHPAAVRLATQSALAGAKLAAALCDDEQEELGMVIAYLKRALKAITEAMDAAEQLKAAVSLPPRRYATLRKRLFQVRDGIILLTGECRSEWRRRYGCSR